MGARGVGRGWGWGWWGRGGGGEGEEGEKHKGDEAMKKVKKKGKVFDFHNNCSSFDNKFIFIYIYM